MVARTALLLVILPALMLTVTTSQAQVGGKPDPWRVGYLEGDPLIVVHRKDSNEYLAYSKLAGKWNRFTFPAGIEATPVMANGICAFALKGDSVSQLVAVDRLGNWCTTKLATPVQQYSPIIDTNMAVVHLQGRVYAFSAELGAWDSVESPHFPSLMNESALVITPDYVAAFSVKTGRWAVAEVTVEVTNRSRNRPRPTDQD
jgi:hypothetical protein